MGRAKRSHKIRCPKEYISTLRSALIGTGPSSPLRRRPPRCAAACRVAPVPRDIPCALGSRAHRFAATALAFALADHHEQ